MYPEHRYPVIQEQKYKQAMSQCYVVMLNYILVLHVCITLNVKAINYKQVLYTELKSNTIHVKYMT